MSDISKEQNALFSVIYKIATDLVHAGHVSEWDFKSYVLGTMFYRYVSENITAYINAGEWAAGNKDFDYTKLSEENISRIVNAVAEHSEEEYFSRMVSYDEVVENGYNLSVSTYVEAEDTREKVDIVKLNAEIKEIVTREQVLRDEIDKIRADIEGGQKA